MEKIDLRTEFINKLKKDRSFNISQEYLLLKNSDYCEWLENKIIHERETLAGWMIDCEPKELLNKLNDSQSDAHNIICEDFEQLNKDWRKFCDNKNSKKSPFFKITGA